MARKSPVIAETKKQEKRIAEGKGAKGHVRQVMGAVVDVQFTDHPPDELSEEDKITVARPQDRALPVAALPCGRGVHRLAWQIRRPRRHHQGFKGLCEGEYDHLPEAAFYMVGTIEEAVAKAEKLAAEAA
jgi:F0F1-type ATP synthase beta subunit